MNDTVMSRIYGQFFGHESSTARRLALIVMLALFMHVMVKVIRQISEWFTNRSHAQENPLGFVTQQPKFISLIKVIANGVILIIYSLAVGLILQDIGVNLMAYWASASIIGLAIRWRSNHPTQCGSKILLVISS
jgi:small-conductance mechanosensitive channel